MSYCEYMSDETIFQTWIAFLPIKELCMVQNVCKKFRTNEMMNMIKKAQCRLILRGLSEAEQYQFWDLNVNFSSLQKAYPLQYAINSMKPSRFERDIMSDVDRTRYFGNNSTLQNNEGSLLRILLALSNSVPKVGYVQGMNTLTAVFLSTKLKESEIYWLIRFIFNKKRFEEILYDGFPQVQVLNYQLEIYAKNYIPELVEYLEKRGIGISYFSTQWFITMFSYDLNFSHLIKIWNFFFVKGWKVVIRVALSLLFHFKNEICDKSGDELPDFLKSCIRDYISQISEDELFKVAFSFKVSNRLLKSLDILYQHSAPANVILTSDKSHHLEWKILSDSLLPYEGSTALIQKDMIEYLNENIDQIRSLNRLRGDAHNELDKYRSIQMKMGTSSLVVDKSLNNTKNRMNMSTDLRSSLNSSALRQSTQKASETTFFQTLTDFGQRIKQILTPKEQAMQAAHQTIRNLKEDVKPSHPPLSERNIFSLSATMPKSKYSFPMEQTIAGRNPLTTILHANKRKNSINSIQPFSTNTHKKNDAAVTLETKGVTLSASDLFDKVEKDILRAPKRVYTHRKNTSMTQDLTQLLTKSHQDKSDCDTEGKDTTSRLDSDLCDLITNKQSNGEDKDERLRVRETNYQGGGIADRKNLNSDNRSSRSYKEKNGEWTKLAREQRKSSENTNTVNYSNLSTDIFDNKDSKKIPSKIGLDEFDLTEGLIQ